MLSKTTVSLTVHNIRVIIKKIFASLSDNYSNGLRLKHLQVNLGIFSALNDANGETFIPLNYPENFLKIV